MDFVKNEKIWIVGASSGIGKALAKELAHQGARIVVSARSEDKLKSLKDELGEEHEYACIDVTDIESCQKALSFIEKHFQEKIDRIIYLPADYENMSLTDLNIDRVKKIIDVNIMGTFNFIKTLESTFAKKKVRQIVLCASVAGYRGLPKGQPYCSTKAAMINLAESLYTELLGQVDVKMICPGFVETPLTEKNKFKMPMIITANQAAQYISNGLVAKSFEIHFPKKFTLILKLLNFLPYWAYFALARKI